jgi:hypothetical protein
MALKIAFSLFAFLQRDGWGCAGGDNMKHWTALVLLAATALGGCGPNHPYANLENTDDATCRSVLAQRHDDRPDAYKECRDHIMQYRRNQAIAASG